jgi:Lrp/AsnC family transcriptional regulator
LPFFSAKASIKGLLFRKLAYQGLIMSSEWSKQDIAVMASLQQDSTVSTAALADRLNSSQSPVWRRINRLEEKGVVQRRVALLDRNALGMEIVVFSTVNLTQTGRQNLLAFEREVETHPEVVECYTMAGIWDYVLKIICKDVRHYEDFVRNTLLSGDLVREMHSHIAVTEIKNTTELPIATQL